MSKLTSEACEQAERGDTYEQAIQGLFTAGTSVRPGATQGGES